MHTSRANEHANIGWQHLTKNTHYQQSPPKHMQPIQTNTTNCNHNSEVHLDGVGGSATLVADLVEFLVILVDNVGPEQGYNLAQFERSRINDIQDKAKIKSCFFFFSKQGICQLSSCYMCRPVYSFGIICRIFHSILYQYTTCTQIMIFRQS